MFLAPLYQQASDGTAITTRYEYTHNGGYLQTRSATTRGGTTAVSNTWRDANGFISNIAEPSFGDLRMNRAFVNDAQGNALYINQAAGQGGRLQNLPGGYVGGFVGDATSPGHIQRQLIAGGQVLGRYGDAPDSLKTQTSGGQVPQYAHTAEFELKAPSLSRESINTEPQRYSASGGESLRDIARNLLGDANLWWRIADANARAFFSKPRTGVYASEVCWRGCVGQVRAACSSWHTTHSLLPSGSRK
ncbi:MAG: hypothetical protein QE290_17730 [Acidovorax sp.]|uniref:hypothetical protein n=1 Tax=Acidovorax sp. TaxID=1872122 RepID=UPI00263589AA|nr:hypothetical protein [Acidovorax sp.]MDH4465871.1 hypothetical protein [Acidovorax sp.]